MAAKTFPVEASHILMFARSVGDEEALCLEAGMDAFLRKPITGAALRAGVDCVIKPASA